MDKLLANEGGNPKDIVPLGEYRSVLKNILSGLDKPRSGRIDLKKGRNIPTASAETILEHSKKVKTAGIKYSNNKEHINTEKVGLMGLVHDVAEYASKDYVPGEISKEEKYEIEKDVLINLKKKWPKVGDVIYDLWLEYEKKDTPESLMVFHLDKMDAAIQALEYMKKGYTQNMNEFYDYTRTRVKDEKLLEILDELWSDKDLTSDKVYTRYFEFLEKN